MKCEKLVYTTDGCTHKKDTRHSLLFRIYSGYKSTIHSNLKQNSSKFSHNGTVSLDLLEFY